jgi:hypothetical protein
MQVGSEYSYIQFAASKSTFSWISQLKQIIKRASDSFSQNFSSIFFRGGGRGGRRQGFLLYATCSINKVGNTNSFALLKDCFVPRLRNFEDEKFCSLTRRGEAATLQKQNKKICKLNLFYVRMYVHRCMFAVQCSPSGHRARLQNRRSRV